jgi:putative glycosyltransferase (TIGR04348 family)
VTGGLDVLLVTPAPPGSLAGNRVTAERWAGILRELGHRVRVAESLEDRAPEVLVALHATRSAESVARYRELRPEGFLVVALTGTDLYRDLPAGDPHAYRSLALADRFVALHPLALEAVPEALRSRVRIIVQSADDPRGPTAARARAARREDGVFRVCVAAHLREVKDPFRAALALSLLPPETAVEVVHLGRALEPALAAEARRLERAERRYRWLGERPHAETREILAGSQLLVISSRMEGAPNVLSEALALGVPVAATRIPGCVGLLGPDHPGLFPVGDTAALAELLAKAQGDSDFYRELARRSRELSERVRPERESAAWERLLAEARGRLSSGAPKRGRQEKI